MEKLTNMPNAQQALEELTEGNKRYASMKLIHPHQDLRRREIVKGGQHPFAVILGCSDSRIPPELIFDQGLGDLFVVRVAGNIVDKVVLGSIEYAVAHLHTPLIMVLGHSRCGAVEASVSNGDLEGHIPILTAAIKPAVNSAQDHTDEEMIDRIAKTNAKMVSEQLKNSSSIISDRVKNGDVMITAAFYSMDTGRVKIL